MESELVAGLCEMWFTLSRWSWKTLSWAIGLILYKNNGLTSVTGILSNLYWKLIRYGNKLMNPFKGSLYHEAIVNRGLKLQLFGNYYIWTSKIMDPTERLAPYIDKKLSKRNNLFLIESGSSIFKYNIIYYTYGLGETIAKSNIRKNIALEKGRNKEIIYIIEKYLNGEILLESNSVNEIANILGYDENYIENYYIWKDYMCINKLPLISLNKPLGFVTLNYVLRDAQYNNRKFLLNKYHDIAIFNPKENNILKCTPTTKINIPLSTTHLNDKFLDGRYLTELHNINSNKDGKFRNLSKFLYNPKFLIKIYYNLKDLKIIKEEIEDEWFTKTAAELKNGNYLPVKVKRSYINNKLILINDDKNKVISEAIRVLLEYVYQEGNDKFLSFSHGKINKKGMHSALQVIKNEWNDISWFITFNYSNIFQDIHRKVLFSIIRDNIQDQRLFDILNKLFNYGVCTLWYYKTFNRYELPDYDWLSYLLINIFFHKLDKKILEIKNDIIINTPVTKDEGMNNNCNKVNIRFVRYFNTFLLGVKGPKSLSLCIKDRVELYLKSDLHLNLNIVSNKNNTLFNIHSDNLYIFNVNISSKSSNSVLSLAKKRKSNEIQQRKKGIKIRKMRKEHLSLKIKSSVKIPKYSVEDKKLSSIKVINNIIPLEKTESLDNICNYTTRTNINKQKFVDIKSNYDNKFFILLNADIIKIKRVLINSGILNNKSRPVAMRKILSLDSYYIVLVYVMIGKLILNSFSYCDNIDNIKIILNYHLRWSLMHSLAAKHKSSIRKTVRDIYPNLLVKKDNKVIQYFTKDQVKSIRRKFLTNNFLSYYNDINWEDKDLNLYNEIRNYNIMNYIYTRFSHSHTPLL